MILLVFVVLLWVAVLAPSAWRRFGERQGVGSIDHFHHQLQLLEHAGPKTVAPAYRLHTALPAFRREQARRRCTVLLRCLGGVAISTALLGLLPGMHLVWVLTGLSGLAALGLVGLMAYAKELEADQARRQSRRDLLDRDWEAGDRATAGYPGAWDDDDFELPRAAAR